MPKRRDFGDKDVLATGDVKRPCALPPPHQKPLTDEQLAVVHTPSSLEAGELVVVDAFAAVGKSFVSRALIQGRCTLRFLYLVFNRKPRREAQAQMSTLGNVVVHTYHSWACDWMRLHTPYKLVVEAGPKDTCVAATNYRTRLVSWLEAQPHLALGQHLSSEQRKIFWDYVVATLETFCLSAETTVGSSHAKLLVTARHQSKHTRAQKAGVVDPTKRRLSWLPHVVQVVRVCNELVQATVAGRIRDVDFGMALKLLHLIVPEVLARQFTTVAVDEAQDMPAVLVAILRAYRNWWGVVLFGDRAQALYRWAGACNGMVHLWDEYAPERRHAHVLSSCFRFSATIPERLLNPLFALARQTLVAPIRSAASHATTVHSLSDARDLFEGKLATVERRHLKPWSLTRYVVDRIRSEPGAVATHAILARNRASLIGVLEELGEEQAVFGIFCCPSVLAGLREALALCSLGEERMMAVFGGGGKKNQDKEDEEEQHQAMVNFVKAHPNRALLAQRLRACLVRVCDEPDKAVLHVFTVHSGKGLEWSHVYLCDDIDRAFESLVCERDTTTGPQEERPELPLVYVALSRSRQSLHLPEHLWHFFQSTAAAAKG